MNLKCPIPRILLPIDGSEDSKRAVQFTANLGASLAESSLHITLLNVTGGSYLSPATSIDLRADIAAKPETFEMIRDSYIKDTLIPILVEGEEILRNAGVQIEVGRLLVDGDPGNEIVKMADKEHFSTIIMARRGLSKIKEFFLGSVTNKVVHTATKQTVYIVGYQAVQEQVCPISKILVPIDGSGYSLKGLEHLSCLASSLKNFIEKITLLHVVNPALYLKRLKEGIDPEADAEKILSEAKTNLLQTQVSEELINTKVMSGTPAEEILKEAEEDYNLIIMGRKGRTALKDLILGGVSSTVLHRCIQPTMALVSSP